LLREIWAEAQQVPDLKNKKVDIQSHVTELELRISHWIERNRPTKLASGVEELKVLTYLSRDL
jgi:hypothetical protein